MFFVRGNTVDCVLFDDCARDAHMCQMQNMSDPVVVVLNLARIAFRDDGKLFYSVLLYYVIWTLKFITHVDAKSDIFHVCKLLQYLF